MAAPQEGQRGFRFRWDGIRSLPQITQAHSERKGPVKIFELKNETWLIREYKPLRSNIRYQSHQLSHSLEDDIQQVLALNCPSDS
jgi:hypothetical protein